MGMTRSHPHELIYHMGDLPCDELIFFFFCVHHGRRALYAIRPAGLVRTMACGPCTHGRRALYAWPAGLARMAGGLCTSPWPAGLVRTMAGGPCTHGRRALHAPWPAGFVRHHWTCPGLAGIRSRGHPPCCKVGSSRHARLRGDPEHVDITTGHVQDWQGYVPVVIPLVAKSAALVMHVYVAIQSVRTSPLDTSRIGRDTFPWPSLL